MGCIVVATEGTMCTLHNWPHCPHSGAYRVLPGYFHHIKITQMCFCIYMKTAVTPALTFVVWSNNLLVAWLDKLICSGSGKLTISSGTNICCVEPTLHSRKRHLFGQVCHVAQEAWQTVSTISHFWHFWALSQILDTQWQWQLPTGTTLLLDNNCTPHFW